MAVVVTQEFEATREEYDAVSEKLGDTPRAWLDRARRVMDLGNGKWKLVDVWESAQDFQNFVQNQLIPAIAEVNPDAPQAGSPRFSRYTNLVKA